MGDRPHNQMSFLWSWVSGVLQSLGLMNKKAKILFLGLDNAGKSTLLHMLKEGRLTQTAPTTHPNAENLRVGNIDFTTYDMGGHDEVRALWQEYAVAVGGIIFLVDCADRPRLDEAKKELDSLLSSDQLHMQNIPFAILGNKIDKTEATPEDELKSRLGLHGLTTGKGRVKLEPGIRPLEVFMCSVKNKQGYGEAFRWLSQYI
eukprot:c32171_g1_i1.p1 GENE.c32171_g1_i1~~c32171_g1_i1.p1  ORF type:complete len:203 (-),score=49.62 c32171_g1_i1:121-729(-)